MGRTRQNRRIGVSELLRILGFNQDKALPLSPPEWIRAYMDKPLAAPTPRPRATRGWHQKPRSSRKGPCYAKLNRRELLGPKHFREHGANCAFQVPA